MKTLDELYAEVNADDALKKEYIKPSKTVKSRNFSKLTAAKRPFPNSTNS